MKNVLYTGVRGSLGGFLESQEFLRKSTWEDLRMIPEDLELGAQRISGLIHPN